MSQNTPTKTIFRQVFLHLQEANTFRFIMKAKQIGYLQWRNRLSEITPSNSRIGEDLLLIKNNGIEGLKRFPFKTDVTTCIIYTRGSVRFRLNMREFSASAPALAILPYDTIFEILEASDDLQTLIVVMSRNFTDSIFSTQTNILPLHKQITDNPALSLKGDLRALTSYYTMLHHLLLSNTPYRLEAARHLTLTLFYSYTCLRHQFTPSTKKERKNEIYEEFVALLRQHYRTEHEVGFYAEKLCITTKYLSQMVKDATGKSAIKWIEEWVITESKALLYSTNQTIQQIADTLGFQNQSLFGKYFKRLTGLSPREYRKKTSTLTEE